VLSHAVAIACHIRLHHYMSKKCQDDHIQTSCEYWNKETLAKLTKVVSLNCLTTGLYVAKCLQSMLHENLVDLTKFETIYQQDVYF